jgi:hypothetical protein
MTDEVLHVLLSDPAGSPYIGDAAFGFQPHQTFYIF